MTMVKCPKCKSSDDVGEGPNDFCCYKCKHIWPRKGTDLTLIPHILSEMREAPGRYVALETAMRRMDTATLRELHRLLRELNRNMYRVKSRARRGLMP